MPRTIPATRMADIADASRRVFRQKGYRRTQVADVAQEVGISPAALYRHVESKEALFHLCFVDELPSADGFVPTPAPDETLVRIRERLRRAAPYTVLRQAVRSAGEDPRAELAAVITELYRTVQANWELLSLVEASARDLPALAEVYYRRGRRSRTDDLVRYLRARSEAGAFRPLEHPELVALQLREACAWFAWHRRSDPGHADLDEEAALAALVDVYVHGLLA